MVRNALEDPVPTSRRQELEAPTQAGDGRHIGEARFQAPGASAGLQSGCACLMSAAMPATTGAACDEAGEQLGLVGTQVQLGSEVHLQDLDRSRRGLGELPIPLDQEGPRTIPLPAIPQPNESLEPGILK